MSNVYTLPERHNGVMAPGDDERAQAVAKSYLHHAGQQIINAPEGQGAGYLDTLASQVFGLVRADYLDLEDTWQHLSGCAVANGLPLEQIDYSLSAAWDRTIPTPLKLDEVERFHNKPEEPEPEPEAEDDDGGKFQLLTRDEIDAIPDLEPMIDGVMDKGTVTMLTAQPAAFKSFLALDWACRYATRTPWQLHPVDNTLDYGNGHSGPGKVLYVAAEGARSIKRRLAAWEKAWNTPVPRHQFRMLAEPVNLGSPAQVAMFCHRMQQAGPFGLVIIDTVARCSLGLEENSATDMGRVIDALYTIRDAMGDDGTVLAIHHEGKNGTVRGSSALLGGVDQLMSLKRDGDHIVLQDEKRKDGMELAPMDLRVKAIHDSLVIEAAGEDWQHNNPLVEDMRNNLAPLLPITSAQLMKATVVPEGAVLRHLAAGLKDGQILSTEEKNPRYSLADEKGDQ